jgi:carboxylesterase
MSTTLAGASPWRAPGGPGGVLLVHGFTGHPGNLRGVAEVLAGDGLAVELPLLPGHGTVIDDMLATTFDDWCAEVLAAHDRLAGRCEAVVVLGQSMGGTLALWLALQRSVAGLVLVNPLVRPQPEEVLEMVRGMVAEGEVVLPGSGSDIADPGVVESAYAGTPLPPLLSLMDGVAGIGRRLDEVSCPVLLITSRQDHVVDPADSDHLAGTVSGPVERVWLERSYHVATLDYDRDIVVERSLAFARKVSA